MDAVIKEALRLIPPNSFAVSRICQEENIVGGITIEKDVSVQIDVFSLHYNKEIWGENVESFVPERNCND
uniref:Galectin n=1 Tax=Acrobeloides nanus TaxID=290746 RepID=A0A914EIZ4_9BILA